MSTEKFFGVDVMNSKNNSKLKLTTLAMAQIAVCTALLCVLSPLAIPLPIPVPFTLQVLIVVLIALVLKPVYALIAQSLYTLLGVVGLPVFSGGKSGIGAVLSPTGGFIIGFLFAAFFVSLLNKKLKIKNPFLRYFLASVVAGIPCIYIPGIAMYMAYVQVDLLSAVVTLTSVFILVDIGKCVIASLLAVPINKALSKTQR